MKKILIILLFIPVILNAEEYFQPFSKKDIILQSIFTGLVYIDRMQTIEFVSNHPDLEERNPILGREPSQERIDVYMLFSIASHSFVTYALPKKYRTTWQMVSIIFQIDSVNTNYSNGIRISVNF